MINFSELLWKPRSRRESSAMTAVAPISYADAESLDAVPTVSCRLDANSRIVYATEPQSMGADRFRFLRMRLRELRELTSLRTVLITSPIPGDGKSTVALNLATALAEGGSRRVLLVDGDLHRGSCASTLHVKTGIGLAECLENNADPLQAIVKIDELGFYLLQAGHCQRNLSELLQSDALNDVMRPLTNVFEWIVVDSPPVTVLSDALSWARHCDTSVVVVRADVTPKEAVDETVSLIGLKHIAGMIFNGADTVEQKYSYYAPKK